MSDNKNVIETLQVDVVLNSDEYKKRLKELESGNDKAESSLNKLDKSHTDLQKNQDKTSKSLSNLVAGFGKFFGTLLVATGVEKLVNDVARANDELGFLEKRLNVSSSTIRNWQGAITAGGGSAEGLNNAFGSLTSTINEFQIMGKTGLQPILSQIGVNMFDLQGKARKADDIMLDLSDTLSKMDSSKAYTIGSQLGFDQGTIGVLIQGRDALKESIEYQDTLYKSSQKDIQNSRELQKNRALLNSQWDSLKTMLANALLPLFNRLTQATLSFFETMQKHQSTVKNVFGGLALLFSASIIPLLTKALTPLLSFLKPFQPFAKLIGVVGTAFILLYDDYKKWADGANSLLDYGALKKFMDENTFSAENLGKAFKELGKGLVDNTLPTLKEYLEIIQKVATGDFKGALKQSSKLLGNFSEKATSVIGTATGQRGSDIAGFIGESAYRFTHYGKKFDQYNPPSGLTKSGFTPEKGEIIKKVANNLSINPNDLAAVISFETGGRFQPNTRNPTSSATGLIQFMGKGANKSHGYNNGSYFGMSRDKFGALSFEDQMQYVEKYYKQRGYKAGQPTRNVADVYTAVTGYGYKKGSEAYNLNKVWDSNGDNYIDKGEAVQNDQFKKHQKNYFGMLDLHNAIQPRMPSLAGNTTNSNTSHNVTVNMNNMQVQTSASTLTGVTEDAMKNNPMFNGLVGVVK